MQIIYMCNNDFVKRANLRHTKTLLLNLLVFDPLRLPNIPVTIKIYTEEKI